MISNNTTHTTQPKQVEINNNSSSSTSQNSDASDASAYVRESLRILKIGGLFAIITTMSPSIFRAVVIDPLGDPHADADGDRNVRIFFFLHVFQSVSTFRTFLSPSASASACGSPSGSIITARKIEGDIVVIIAKSPPIFRILRDSLTYAEADGDRNVRNVLTDWKTCKKKKIRTNEGGYVYFYPIRKTSHFLGGKLNKVDERGERGNN